MIEHALQYASRGWHVFRLNGFKTPLKGSHGHLDASTDRATIERWWAETPGANIGLRCGAIVVLDLDGPTAVTRLAALAAPHGDLPRTLTARSARGYHLFFRSPDGVEIRTRNEPRAQKGADGIDIKGHGGYVVLSPSVNRRNGFVYQWVTHDTLADMPAWLVEWCGQRTAQPQTAPFGPLPAYLQQHKTQSNQTSITDRAYRGLSPWSPAEEARIRSALQAIPATGYDRWRGVGMALHSLGWDRPDGTSRGFELFDCWSQTAPDDYSAAATETKWNSFGRRAGVTLGTLFHLAEQAGWQGLAPPAAPDNPQPPVTDNPLFMNGRASASAVLPVGLTEDDQFTSPLIRLNEQYAVIGDIGGKCLVMGWVPSKVDETIRVPSFQAFKAFSERYASKYVMIRKAKGEEWVSEPTQLGAHWLKWKHRTTYDGIDLMPEAEPVLPGNVLNLWDGFGVEPAEGKWDRIKEHIAEILAQGSTESLVYIMKWAAWAVQNPGERAEVALVFRGAKGSGKGTFANAMKRIFGQHGLQIFNSKHLVGSFNGHLRNCLLLFADEAFWAGDKQGESVLKGMLTEPALMIEQKGIDAAPWRNRLHVIMAANAEWVVPASHDERRYAVFSVSEKRLRQEKYFDALHREMQEGGLSAMLHDLQRVNLKGWHPRRIVQTEALQQQKLRSLDPKLEWFEGLLQDGLLPYSGAKEGGRTIPTQFVMHHIRENAPRMRDVSTTAIGLFLRGMGCIKMHSAKGNAWQFQPLAEARGRWENRFQGWSWDAPTGEWGNRG